MYSIWSEETHVGYVSFFFFYLFFIKFTRCVHTIILLLTKEECSIIAHSK